MATRRPVGETKKIRASGALEQAQALLPRPNPAEIDFRRHDGQWWAAITVYGTDSAGISGPELDMIVTAEAISETPSP